MVLRRLHSAWLLVNQTRTPISAVTRYLALALFAGRGLSRKDPRGQLEGTLAAIAAGELQILQLEILHRLRHGAGHVIQRFRHWLGKARTIENPAWPADRRGLVLCG